MSFAGVLVKENLKAWLRARGFWLILIAAFVPPMLTGAWVATHQNDVAVTDIEYDGELAQGSIINITATVQNVFNKPVAGFNATIQVGYFQERVGGPPTFVELASESYSVPGLAAGATTRLSMPWEAEPGVFIFQAVVDPEQDLREIEAKNNHRFIQVTVPFQEQRFDDAPGTNGTADLHIVSTTWDPSEIFRNDQANITVTVQNNGTQAENATVRLQVHRAAGSGQFLPANPNLSERVTLAPGEQQDVVFTWTPTQSAFYALVTTVGVDQDTPDDALVQYTSIHRKSVYQEPEERATAKDFYRDVLGLLHLRLLIPLIALFYAGSVLEDEREKGHLPYLLTRPVPRWMLPLTRFVTTVLVAGLALLVGVIATLVVLLGTPQQVPGFLFWPVWFTLLALAVYSAVFTLVGVATRRPYLVGLLYVIGFEAVIFFGQRILVNDRPLLQDWVLNLSLNHWMQRAFDGWDPSLGAQWVPATSAAVQAMWVLLGVAVASLAAAVWWIQRREFED